MTAREFCYWLQGYFEISETGTKNLPNGIKVDEGLTSDKVQVIKKHLNLVFKHEIDPSYPDSKELDKIHNPHLSPESDKKIRC